MLSSINPSGTKTWQKLRDHFIDMQYEEMKDMFRQDDNRAQKFHIQLEQFLVDFF